jgi:hypothetical protein
MKTSETGGQSGGDGWCRVRRYMQEHHDPRSARAPHSRTLQLIKFVGGRYSYRPAGFPPSSPSPFLCVHTPAQQVTKIETVCAVDHLCQQHDTKTPETHTENLHSNAATQAINTPQATMLTPTPPTHGMGKANTRLEAHQPAATTTVHMQECQGCHTTHGSTNTPSKHSGSAAHCGLGRKAIALEDLRLCLFAKLATRQASHPPGNPRASKPSPTGQKLSRAQARACQLFETSQGPWPTTGLPAHYAARLVARGRECAPGTKEARRQMQPDTSMPKVLSVVTHSCLRLCPHHTASTLRWHTHTVTPQATGKATHA